MRDFKDKGLSERLQNAARAKQALVQKLRERPLADDPLVLQRKAERAAIAAAREARANAKALEEKEKAEQEARGNEERALQAMRQAEEDELRKAQVEAEQKLARDARYAARKKRKG